MSLTGRAAHPEYEKQIRGPRVFDLVSLTGRTAHQEYEKQIRGARVFDLLSLAGRTAHRDRPGVRKTNTRGPRI